MANHMSHHMDIEPDDEKTPRSSPIKSSDISTIHAGQGVHMAREKITDGLEEQNPHTRRNMIVLVIITLIALVALFCIVRCVASSHEAAPEKETKQTESAYSSEKQQDEQDAQGKITYQGSTYAIEKQDDGKYGITRDGGSGNKTIVFKVDGTPTNLVLYNGTILVPENNNGKWDVVAYTIGDGALPVLVADKSGNTVGGEGTIASAVLDGTSLKVTDSGGNVTNVALE